MPGSEMANHRINYRDDVLSIFCNFKGRFKRYCFVMTGRRPKHVINKILTHCLLSLPQVRV